MTVFDQVFKMVVGSEGGYVNDPNDAGGETKYGISKRSYPSVNIPALTLESAKAIYLHDFWNKIKGDSLPPSLAALVFDAAINSGPSQAVRWLQMALGVAADGIIGPVTLAAVAAYKPGWELMAKCQAQRILFMSGLDGEWDRYKKGWVERVQRLSYQALSINANT